MIKMQVTSGPYAGRVRGITAEDPTELFRSLMDHGWTWEVDYSKATQTEIFVWGRADLVARCVRAILKGLPVKFLGKKYFDAGELEDAIVASGRMVAVGRDDASGVEIAVGEREGN